MTASTRTGIVCAALILPLALAACGADSTGQPEQRSSTEAIFTSVGAAPEAAPETPTVTEVITTTSTQAPPETSTPPDDTCADLPKDPRKQYETGTAPGRMPAADGSDYNFWIDNIENHYDPCAPLSWIIFDGQLGDVNGPAGTAASIADGLALYINGEPAREMKLFGRIDNITPLENGGTTFEWSERGQYTADGYVNHYSAELRVIDGAVTAVAGDTAKFHEWWDYPVSYLLGTYD